MSACEFLGGHHSSHHKWGVRYSSHGRPGSRWGLGLALGLGVPLAGCPSPLLVPPGPESSIVQQTGHVLAQRHCLSPLSRKLVTRAFSCSKVRLPKLVLSVPVPTPGFPPAPARPQPTCSPTGSGAPCPAVPCTSLTEKVPSPLIRALRQLPGPT